jgi:CRISPR/Cas system CSM-associated protein Csm3 (group 7 of RAMP superfamily)
MARDTVSITTLTVLATTRSPLHIGGRGSAAGPDAPVSRDARGRPIIPGTALTGALRDALGQSTPHGLWGGSEEEFGASRIVVHDATLTAARSQDPSAVAVLGRRDGVAIDRALGSAVDGLLYGREVVPTGWWARIVVDLHAAPGGEPDALAALGEIRAVLTNGLALGARTSRGLGELRADAADVTITQVRFDTAEAFWRTRRTPDQPDLPTPNRTTPDTVTIDIDWCPDGPVVVGSGSATANLSFVPVLEPDPHGGAKQRLRLVLPGTAVAGALRARAELICRTLTGRGPSAEFTEQLADTPLVAAVFGSAAGVNGATRSRLTVHDCASTTTVDTATWRGALAPVTQDDTVPRPARKVAGAGSPSAELRRTEHVAVDRWTGGASDGRLFSEYEPHGFAFEPLRLRLRLSGLPEAHRRPAVMLLLLTIRELAQGRLPLGGRTTRGYGAVSVTGLTLSGPDLPTGTIAELDLYADTFSTLRQAWRHHLTNQEKATA